MNYTRFEIFSLLSNCLLYKIRPNVRIIFIKYNFDKLWIKMLCSLDTEPDEIDKELMEDAISLFISYDNNYELNFELSVEFSNLPFNEIVITGDLIIYARYEEGIA